MRMLFYVGSGNKYFSEIIPAAFKKYAKKRNEGFPPNVVIIKRRHTKYLVYGVHDSRFVVVFFFPFAFLTRRSRMSSAVTFYLYNDHTFRYFDGIAKFWPKVSPGWNSKLFKDELRPRRSLPSSRWTPPHSVIFIETSVTTPRHVISELRWRHENDVDYNTVFILNAKH